MPLLCPSPLPRHSQALAKVHASHDAIVAGCAGASQAADVATAERVAALKAQLEAARTGAEAAAELASSQAATITKEARAAVEREAALQIAAEAARTEASEAAAAQAAAAVQHATALHNARTEAEQQRRADAAAAAAALAEAVHLTKMGAEAHTAEAVATAHAELQETLRVGREAASASVERHEARMRSELEARLAASGAEVEEVRARLERTQEERATLATQCGALEARLKEAEASHRGASHVERASAAASQSRLENALAERTQSCERAHFELALAQSQVEALENRQKVLSEREAALQMEAEAARTQAAEAAEAQQAAAIRHSATIRDAQSAADKQRRTDAASAAAALAEAVHLTKMGAEVEQRSAIAAAVAEAEAVRNADVSALGRHEARVRSGLEARLAASGAEAEEVRARLERTQEERATLATQCGALEARLKEAEASHRGASHVERASAAASQSRLEDTLAERARSLDEAQTECAAWQARCTALEERHTHLLERLREQETLVDAAEQGKGVAVAECAALEQRLREQEELHKTAQGDLLSSRLRLDGAERWQKAQAERLRDHEAQVQRLQSALAASGDEVGSYEARMQQQRCEQEALVKRLVGEHAQEATEWMRALALSKGEHDALLRRHSGIFAAADRLVGDISERVGDTELASMATVTRTSLEQDSAARARPPTTPTASASSPPRTPPSAPQTRSTVMRAPATPRTPAEVAHTSGPPETKKRLHTSLAEFLLAMRAGKQ